MATQTAGHISEPTRMHTILPSPQPVTKKGLGERTAPTTADHDGQQRWALSSAARA
ncbi:hypothetical protein [Corynebacterium kefirresidentii]|uniref:hypothetical protein n=1 Tax=Corynebacterium kefirresidentii TaxID=1979527 RepID=UPI001302DB5B|nr:hypothetical protein [Corynebacterium kefirresidentii]